MRSACCFVDWDSLSKLTDEHFCNFYNFSMRREGVDCKQQTCHLHLPRKCRYIEKGKACKFGQFCEFDYDNASNIARYYAG